MFKIKIITTGKNKENWLTEALQEYEKRLSPHTQIEWILTKTEAQLEEILKKEEAFICLDPRGKQLSSPEFASFLNKELIKQGSRLNFAIGGSEGFSEAIKKKAAHLLSFSTMTFTHQMSRLILLEQLYRAFEIRKGSAYHK